MRHRAMLGRSHTQYTPSPYPKSSQVTHAAASAGGLRGATLRFPFVFNSLADY